jgi:hypothetical protein
MWTKNLLMICNEIKEFSIDFHLAPTYRALLTGHSFVIIYIYILPKLVIFSNVRFVLRRVSPHSAARSSADLKPFSSVIWYHE